MDFLIVPVGLLVCGAIGWAMGKYLTKKFLAVLTFLAFLFVMSIPQESFGVIIFWLYMAGFAAMFGSAWAVQLQESGGGPWLDKLVGLFIKQQ